VLIPVCHNDLVNEIKIDGRSYRELAHSPTTTQSDYADLLYGHVDALL
jgi:hypothetical protein